MDNSCVLLSSMSPKVQQHKKHGHKFPVTKLALKKNFRRSSIYDRKAEASSLITVDDSTESNSSSDVARKLLNTSPIIISSTEPSEIGDDGLEEAAAVDIKRRSLHKTADIEQWIESVNLERENRESLMCNKVSKILAERTREGSTHSVFADEKITCRFDELFQSKTDDEKGEDKAKRSSSSHDAADELSCKSVIEDSFKGEDIHGGHIKESGRDTDTTEDEQTSVRNSIDGKIGNLND